MLAKRRWNGYVKREPRHLLGTDAGAGTARFAPPVLHDCHAGSIFDPVSVCARYGVNCYMASDASSRTSISAKNAIKNRRDMADTSRAKTV